MIRLSGEQVERLQKALLGAFPNRPGLRQMVRFKLEVHLDEIAEGNDLSEVIFNLITWVETQGRLQELLLGACEMRPDNKDFKRLLVDCKIKPQPAAYEYNHPWMFDLETLVEDFFGMFLIQKIQKQAGLLGFTVPLTEPAPTFLKHLCARLHLECRRRDVSIAAKDIVISVDGIKTTVEQAKSQIIRQCKPTLQRKHVLCTVQALDSDKALSLWREIQAVFQDDMQYLLVLIMGVKSGCLLEQVHTLQAPHFPEHHIITWTYNIIRSRGWSDPEDDLARAAKLYMEHIRDSSQRNVNLDVDTMYAVLESTLREIQDYDNCHHFCEYVLGYPL
jgi:hypothetical protein